MIELAFHSGTLTLSGAVELPDALEGLALSDPRSGIFRARACDYAPIVMALLRHRIPFVDHAKNYAPLPELRLLCTGIASSRCRRIPIVYFAA